jgi:hypothetical protein
MVWVASVGWHWSRLGRGFFQHQIIGMAKDKKSKATAAAAEAQNADNEDDNTTEVIIKENIVKIAHPLAGKKLTKKILKTVKKGMILADILLIQLIHASSVEIKTYQAWC